MNMCAESGVLCDELLKFVGDRPQTDGKVTQRLKDAIQREVTSYHHMLADIEAGVQANPEGTFSLRWLYVELEPAIIKLRLFSSLSRGCQGRSARVHDTLFIHCIGKSAGSILSHIYNVSNNGDPVVHDQIAALLSEVSVPFFDILELWIREGELQDPFLEFFVVKESNQEILPGIVPAFRLNQSLIPPFISAKLARKVSYYYYSYVYTFLILFQDFHGWQVNQLSPIWMPGYALARARTKL